MKNDDIQMEVFTNNIRWLKNYLDLRINAMPFEDYGLNN